MKGSESVSLSGVADEPTLRSVPVHVFLFGSFRLVVDGQPLHDDVWRRRKARQLFKCLLTRPQRCLLKDEAMELFWPESEPEAASSNLRTTVHALRKALGVAGDGLIVEDRASYAVRPDAAIWVDADAFAATVERARAAADPFPLLEHANSLYTGDFLPEDLYEDWAAVRRDQLKRLWTELQFTLARLRQERHQPELAVAALERLLQADACDELAARELMSLLGQAGRRSAALRVYQRLASALRTDLGVEPSLATVELHQQMASASEAPLAHTVRLRERRHNLPAELNSFVGREKPIAELGSLLARTRLLTLVGAGGVGKSRLALHLAAAMLRDCEAGVWLVELAPLADPVLVASAVASVLGVIGRRGRPLLGALADSLRDRQLLLVLDNCEHLLGACAEVSKHLLETCPLVRIVATSREPLGVNGEVVRRVPSLSVPGDRLPERLDRLVSYGAVALFADRVLATSPEFALTDRSVPAVVEICRRLDGIPLALELAAARVGPLTVEQIAERLGQALRLLVVGSRGGPMRHQTLRAALDWSYGLLSPPEQRLFERLSVFAGGWTLEAAEAVGVDQNIGAPGVLDLLAGLVDKSMVMTEQAGDRTVRYRLLETLRQYGQEHLEVRGEAEPARSQHADYFRSLGERAEPHLRGGPEFARWLKALTPELDNLRAALRWCVDRRQIERGLRLGAAVSRFVYVRGGSHGHRLGKRLDDIETGLTAEGLEWLDLILRLIPGSGRDAVGAAARREAGFLALQAGEPETAQTLLEDSLAIWREVGDAERAARCFDHLGRVVASRGDVVTARRMFTDSLAFARMGGHRVWEAGILRRLGNLYAEAGDPAAQAAFARAVEINREVGDELSAVWCTIELAFVTHQNSDPASAQALFRRSLQYFGPHSESHCVPDCIEGLAAVAANQGEAERAFRLAGAAAGVREVFGHPPNRRDRNRLTFWLDPLRAALGEHAVAEMWMEGEAMSVEQLIAYALDETPEEHHVASG